MVTKPRIRLSRLRDIGWSLWDPIGILSPGDCWQQIAFPDEYDAYLLCVASQLRQGATEQVAVDYLVEIELNHMGLEFTSLTFSRASNVVRAINSDSLLWNESSTTNI
ncbi:MAG: hypothetical protein JKY10_00785 [Cohaesibacteraceae bacterium]|nr:hypothetical protein [Cohaesibacteraceae bacterium]